MGDSSSVWGAVLSGLAAAYGSKKKKDAQQDAYKYQQQELQRQRQYAEEMYQRKQNAPQAKMARYMMEYYMPQMVEKLKSHNKGGDTSVLDRMLADIMGGIKSNAQHSSSGGYGGSDPFLTSGSLSSESAKRSGIAYSKGKGYLGDSGEFFATPEAAMNSNRNGGASYSMGRLDPEIEGYNGKSWSGERYGSVDGDPFAREQTHGMGNVTTQTERGYTVQHQPWNMIDEGADIGIPNQQGTLATGGTLNVATEGMDIGQIPLGALRSMMGFGGGPTGKNYTPSGTWKDGKFQMADLYDYSKMHPWLWKILKGAGNMILPGSASIGDAVVQYGVPRGVGDGKPNNASIHRVR